MLKPHTHVQNERGYVLVLVLMTLAILTIVGVAVLRTSNTEVQIASNELLYQRNFYLAEGAAIEAADRLGAIPNPQDDPPPWLVTETAQLDDGHLEEYWAKLEVADPQGVRPEKSVLNPAVKAHYIAGLEGIAPGSSLGMGKTRVHVYAIYGRCMNTGEATIKLGYRKAF
ncbi:MAG: hypothetical protein JSW39_13670 [Desulfobacterales bacterium]|nr:MAG: hypothetical protein JSW39_13670 [Desulfobacterales bacterium]